MDIIPIQCPHCLGELEVNWGVGTAVCLYCRGKMVIKLPFDHAKIAQSSPLTDKQLALTQLAALLKKISLPSAALRKTHHQPAFSLDKSSQNQRQETRCLRFKGRPSISATSDKIV